MSIKEEKINELCGYFNDGRRSTYIVLHDTDRVTARESKFKHLEEGLLGQNAYAFKTDCEDCNACESVRIHLPDYSEKKRERKAIRHGDRAFKISVSSGSYDADHYSLFKKYMSERHPESDMNSYSPELFKEMLSENSHVVDIRSQDETLEAFSIVDIYGDSASVEQICYNEGAHNHNSMGKYTYLKTLELLKMSGIRFAYTGLWAEDSPKTGHKTNNPNGLEVFSNGSWSDFEAFQASKNDTAPGVDIIPSVTIDS